MTLKAFHIPQMITRPAEAGTAYPKLTLLDAVTDGLALKVSVGYSPKAQEVYSISAVSPVRGRSEGHEVFIGRKATFGFRAEEIWDIYFPALYPTVEVRKGILSPAEVVGDRLEVTSFRSGEVTVSPLPPNADFHDAYMRESNVPKVFPGEFRRLFPKTLRRTSGVWLDYAVAREFHGAIYYNFSVVNNIPIPNITYGLELSCASGQWARTLDRQFWYSRDEVLAIVSTPCERPQVTLRAVTLLQAGLHDIGRHGWDSVGPVLDTMEGSEFATI